MSRQNPQSMRIFIFLLSPNIFHWIFSAARKCTDVLRQSKLKHDFPANRITLRSGKALRIISQQIVLLSELERLYESFWSILDANSPFNRISPRAEKALRVIFASIPLPFYHKVLTEDDASLFPVPTNCILGCNDLFSSCVQDPSANRSRQDASGPLQAATQHENTICVNHAWTLTTSPEHTLFVPEAPWTLPHDFR